MKTYTCESCGKQFTDGGIVFKMDDHDAALCEAVSYTHLRAHET